jgi:pimeloyl-ACP methyl ester carboxylesterase
MDILILHGWGSKSDNWKSVKRFLEKDKEVKVHIPDLPGFGKKAVPKKPWSTDDYAKWVNDFCKRKKFENIALVGHSFGGGLAVKFSALHPERVKKLILVNAAVIRSKSLKYYPSLVVAKTANLILSAPYLSKLKPFLRKGFYRLIGTSDYSKLDLDKTNVMKGTFKKVVSEDLSCYLPAVQAETLVIWGDKDMMTPISHGYAINAKIPKSRMEIIKGAKHAINLEFPDVLAEKILKFIK